NSENGYEYLSGHPTEKKQVHSTDKVRHSSWRIVCAGGYFAAGFNGTIGHSDAWNRIDAPNHYTFIVRDEGAANQLGSLYTFFTALPFERLQPFDGIQGDAVALAEPGKKYVVYMPHGGKVTVDLGAAKHELMANWFNPRDGTWGKPFAVVPDRPGEFQSPDALDWVLVLNAGKEA
ncbi:MAG TPA: putative collagen-binding domain-containing protein, partial [Chthoniobacter sp.]|nr:putative collagen-binding domain-containing protein [Chthoniobacter sp.]